MSKIDCCTKLRPPNEATHAQGVLLARDRFEVVRYHLCMLQCECYVIYWYCLILIFFNLFHCPLWPYCSQSMSSIRLLQSSGCCLGAKLWSRPWDWLFLGSFSAMVSLNQYIKNCPPPLNVLLFAGSSVMAWIVHYWFGNALFFSPLTNFLLSVFAWDLPILWICSEVSELPLFPKAKLEPCLTLVNMTSSSPAVFFPCLCPHISMPQLWWIVHQL